MKRMVAMTALSLLALAPILWASDAWAEGDGYAGGSRGARASSSGKPSSGSGSGGWVESNPKSYSSPSAPSLPRPGSNRSWTRSVIKLLLGGLIGSVLLGRASMGGLGLLEVMALAGLTYVAFRYLHDRPPAPVGPPGYAGATSLDGGIGSARRVDPNFDPGRFGETVSHLFLKLQAAWTARDAERAAEVLTPELAAVFQSDCDRMRAEGRINHLEQIAVRAVEVTEAWQEQGQDYVTVRLQASLIDYITDEHDSRMLDGSQAEPVRLDEFWTFVRPVGPNRWKLSAIEQPA
jgi:predicted lipid-binding transport protein (Tim44 family)